jgi:hypothetical protein
MIDNMLVSADRWCEITEAVVFMELDELKVVQTVFFSAPFVLRHFPTSTNHNCTCQTCGALKQAFFTSGWNPSVAEKLYSSGVGLLLSFLAFITSSIDLCSD